MFSDVQKERQYFDGLPLRGTATRPSSAEISVQQRLRTNTKEFPRGIRRNSTFF